MYGIFPQQRSTTPHLYSNTQQTHIPNHANYSLDNDMAAYVASISSAVLPNYYESFPPPDCQILDADWPSSNDVADVLRDMDDIWYFME